MERVILKNGTDIDTLITQEGDTTFIQSVQECSDVLESCKEERAQDMLRGHRKTDSFHCVAELPMVLVEALRAQGIDIMNDTDALKMVLNSPEFKAFRTSGGRV